MQLRHADNAREKGWYAGPWNGTLALPIGYATAGINDPHAHTQVTEIYLVARGTAQVRIEHETVEIGAGDMLVVEPGEAHTFLSNSPEYFHFVVQTPGLPPEEIRQERHTVTRAHLGL